MLKRPNSTISIRNPNHIFNFKSKTINNKFNKDTSNTIYQSPKLYSGKMRYILENKKLFSLLDLNEKITNSKGPSLPIQFKRMNSEEIRDLFNGNITKAYEALKKLKFSSLKNNKIKIPKAINKESYVFNEDSNNRNIKSENKEYDEEKNDTENNIQKYTAHTDQGILTKLNNKKDDILKRPNTSRFSYINKNNLENLENDKENKNIKNDKWMPTNYRKYEQIVKDRKLFIQKMKLNPFFSRLPSCTLNDIQTKNYNTDIFFINPPKSNSKFNSYINYKKNIKKQNNSIDCYYNSDIFNIKNDDTNLQKIGEKYLLNNTHKNIKYTSSRESKSEWEGFINKDSINNCSSKEYNILIPSRKNNNLTKEKIYNTLDDTNNNKYNPIHKYKCISKFIDLANNSSSNLGKDYINCYNLNPNCFKKIPENCSAYGDLFLQYKNVCDRPFYKKDFLI